MTTLADLETASARALRDSGNAVWTVGELDNLINAGIDALADFYPKEIVSTLGTVAANTRTYATTLFTNIYRLDVYTSAGSYDGTLPATTGGADSGWSLHGGVVYLPVNWPLTAGDTLLAFGYGRYAQLSAQSQVINLDASGEWAVIDYVKAEAFGNLMAERASFQQWQAAPGNTDVTQTQLYQSWLTSSRRWDRHKQRLRRLRKRG